MIQCQLKLKLTKQQERDLECWLYHLTSVWNWAIRKIELDAKNRIYYRRLEFKNLLPGVGRKLQIPSHVIQGTLGNAHLAWQYCFKKIARKPRLKGQRNKLNSVAFPDSFPPPRDNRITIPGLGKVRFHKQQLPLGKVKCGRIIRRASGWYLCLFIDAEPNTIPIQANGTIGIDPGFKHLITLSTGQHIRHPRELEAKRARLGQAQRGCNRHLTARIQERIANQRKDRNHKLSRRLVAENAFIAFSADPHNNIKRKFGKSVTSSGHAQLRSMLSYKCRAGGRTYIEVNPTNFTKTCSACGALTGPTGLAGLSVRQWTCAECGSLHDRDINAAINTLIAGAGAVLERSAA